MNTPEALRDQARAGRVTVLRRLVGRLQRIHATSGDDVAAGPGDSVFNRIYGGQSPAESVMAAATTVPAGQRVSSVHCHFLRLGKPALPVRVVVERLRDTRSNCVRWVQVEQQGQVIMAATFSFMVPGEGLSHQWSMPETIGPESLPSRDEVLLAIHGPGLPANAGIPWPLDLRHVDRHPWDAGSGPGYQRIWMRADETLSDDPLLHAGLLLFASDLTMFESMITWHGIMWEDVVAGRGLFGVTLNHCVWLHNPTRVDDWLLPRSGIIIGRARPQFHHRALLRSVQQAGGVCRAGNTHQGRREGGNPCSRGFMTGLPTTLPASHTPAPSPAWSATSP